MSTDATHSVDTMATRITVGYLATASGDDGVALAVALARAIGAPIDLVCVVRSEEPDGTPGRAAYQDLLIRRAREWVAAGADLVPDDVEVEIHTPVAESFTEGLIDFADSSGARMIVVSRAWPRSCAPTATRRSSRCWSPPTAACGPSRPNSIRGFPRRCCAIRCTRWSTQPSCSAR